MKQVSKSSALIIAGICILLLTSCGTVKKQTFDAPPAQEELTVVSNIPVTSKINVANNSTTYTLTGISGSVENDSVVTIYATNGSIINACNATSRGEFQIAVQTTDEVVVLSATAQNKKESAKAVIGLVSDL